MSPDRFQQLDALVSGALELPPAERSAYLAAQSGSDAALAEEAAALLQLSDEEFLETPILNDPRLYADGTELGPYRLGPLLGRGGMGAVYQAARADGQFDKQVAIKLIEQVLSSPVALARFEQERKILARLEHPFIARLLDAGLTASGSPYLVMELVDGIPCTARRLAAPVALLFFEQVCATVQYAHQNLIIHRDLKPSNILLTPANTPKLVDFGIAKVLDPELSTDETQVDQRLMTVNYASPEQILRQPVSTATDIYSLGLILAELLTGEPVRRYASMALPELVRMAEAPVRLPTTLPAELRAIIGKATAVDPLQRYPSAHDLAADVERYRLGRPVLAHPPSGFYLARKFAVRYRWALAAAMVVLMLAGTAVATIIAQRNLAEARLGYARDFARAALFEFEPVAAELPGALPLRQKIASRTAVLLDQLSATLGSSDTELQRELAEAYSQLGHVQGGISHSNVGLPEKALASYQRAVAARRALAAAKPGDSDALALLAEAEITLGNQWRALGKQKDGEASLDSAASHLARAGGGEVSLNAQGRLAFARRDFAKFLEISNNLRDQFPTSDRYQRNVALAHKYLAAAARQPADRLAHARLALETDEKRLAARPTDVSRQLDLSFDLSTLGSFSKRVDPAAAAAYFRRTVEIRRAVLASDPVSVLYRDRLAAALVYWGFADQEHASAAFSEAVKLAPQPDTLLIAQLGASLFGGPCPTVVPAVLKLVSGKFGLELADWRARRKRCEAK